MTIQTPTKPKPARPNSGGKKNRRVLLFGDSHAHAVERAIAKRVGKGLPVTLTAHRLLKDKGDIQIGNITFEAFLKLASTLGPDDVVVSLIGGNQHAVYSTVQHRLRFDFYSPDVPSIDEAASEIVPYRAIEAVFDTGLRSGDGRLLETLRSATAARIVHVLSPPPKEDSAHITRYHETAFKQDLPKRGVSSAHLRLKFWKLQSRIVRQICSELNIEVMAPPKRTVDEGGFLRPEFYATDATHGNWRYGERVIREVERLYPETATGPARK
jgi:hypothetical protein